MSSSDLFQATLTSISMSVRIKEGRQRRRQITVCGRLLRCRMVRFNQTSDYSVLRSKMGMIGG